MASADLNVAIKKDLPLSNPWPWLAIGLGLAVWSWLWAVTYQATASDTRVIVLAFGLLASAAGLWLQWADRRSLHLPMIAPPALVRLAREGMGLIYGLLALAVTALWILSIIQWEGLGWRPGVTTLVWLTVAPVSWCAARRAIDLKAERAPIETDEECGLAFLIAGLTAGFGSMALDLGPQLVNDWDTMRLALRVLTAVTLTAGALVVVSTRVRRLVLSFVITLHFCGIASATLAAHPAPQIVQQIWTRIFRPYLEFMYLTNAYHFYAPEPGPQSYMWFRLIYEDTADGKEVGRWEKFPRVDDEGRSLHPVQLEYMRYLVFNENFRFTSPAPVPNYYDEDNMLKTRPIYANRLQPGLTPGLVHDPDRRRKGTFKIPLYPNVDYTQQLFIPNEPVKKLIASYARHVAHRFATVPGEPSLKFKSVKMYRVEHQIVPGIFLVNGMPPTDPVLYKPIYLGNYDADGKLLETSDDDPYLYWWLPILSDRLYDPLAPIKDYARRHAGDPKWVRNSFMENGKVHHVWINPKEDPQLQMPR